MKFFKQTKPNTCNIIAIQHALSYFNQYPTFKEIKSSLPKHSFGNTIQELAEYLNKRKIKTTILAKPTQKDIKNKPIIINIDSMKIKKSKGKPIPHYIVLLKENSSLYIYDGVNFKRKIKRTFEEIYETSLDINKLHKNGMWLITQ